MTAVNVEADERILAWLDALGPHTTNEIRERAHAAVVAEHGQWRYDRNDPMAVVARDGYRRLSSLARRGLVHRVAGDREVLWWT